MQSGFIQWWWKLKKEKNLPATWSIRWEYKSHHISNEFSQKMSFHSYAIRKSRRICFSQSLKKPCTYNTWKCISK